MTAATVARIAALALALAACDRPRPAPPRVEAPPAAKPGPASLLTVMDRPDARTFRIRLRAPAEHALQLENCNGAFPWGLENRRGGTWKSAWNVATNACYSTPIVIAPGETRTFDIGIGVGERIEEDTYRLIVYGLHHTDPSIPRPAADTQIPRELRVSEPFQLGPLEARP